MNGMNVRKVIFLIGVAGILLIAIVVSALLGSPKKEIPPARVPTQFPLISYAPPPRKAGISPTFLPDTQPEGGVETDEMYMRTYTPDVYLANKTPFTGITFSVTRTFKTTPGEHFGFIVTAKGNSSSYKSDTISWLKSLGLTDSQIRALDIEYR